MIIRTNNKKGVAPLIATVLLIAFTISIGVLVVSWGREYIETTTEETSQKIDTDLSCSMDVAIKVKEIMSNDKICYNGSSRIMEIMLENMGREDVAGIRIITIDSDDSIDLHDNISFGIPAGTVSEKYVFNYTSNLSDEIQMVEIIPLVKFKGSKIPKACSSKSLNIEEIPECS